MFGGLIVLFVVSIVAISALGSRPVATPTPGSTDPGVGDTASGGQGQPVDGINCDTGEQLAYHLHAHLYILVDGKPQKVSEQIGIPAKFPPCLYWLHTHDTTGIIHIESPSRRSYTLGQFFDIWGMPLNRTDVAVYPVPSDGLTVFVDGKQFTDDPRNIELRAHTQVVIELGQVGPPPPFEFPAGL